MYFSTAESDLHLTINSHWRNDMSKRYLGVELYRVEERLLDWMYKYAFFFSGIYLESNNLGAAGGKYLLINEIICRRRRL